LRSILPDFGTRGPNGRHTRKRDLRPALLAAAIVLLILGGVAFWATGTGAVGLLGLLDWLAADESAGVIRLEPVPGISTQTALEQLIGETVNRARALVSLEPLPSPCPEPTFAVRYVDPMAAPYAAWEA